MILFRKAVLLIHGFAGGTYDLEPLEIELQKNWNLDVYTFTLPGHDKRSIHTKKFEEWIYSSEEMLNRIKNYGYKDIYVVGHSMGGVIASYLASKYPFVKKVVLASPAFRYIVNEDDPTKSKLLKSGLGMAIKSDKSELVTRFTKLPLSSANEFSKLVKEYRNTVKNIKIPVLIVHGTQDELVPVESSKEIIKKIKSNKKELFLLEGGTHAIFKSKNSELVIEKIEGFLK